MGNEGSGRSRQPDALCSRHCNPARSPRVLVTIESFAAKQEATLPGVMLACSCTNLQSLRLISAELALPVAQASLCLVPPTLQHLGLQVSAEIADASAWGRLTRLTSLDLMWPLRDSTGIFTTFDGYGLAMLRSLRELYFDAYWRTDRLMGKNLSPGSVLAELSRLSFRRDPFEGKVDLSELPGLLEIIHSPAMGMPSWLEDQDFCHFVLGVTGQYLEYDLSKLRCRQLSLFHGESATSGFPMPITMFLDMACLEHIVVRTFGKSPGISRLQGTQSEYRALMTKVSLDLQMPAELHNCEFGQQASSIYLQRNGHTVVCLCADCKKTAEARR